jgi:hypothetical protein
LFEPQDDFRLDQPPSQPELLEWLADDFMRHGYDLKHTIRSILTSRTYQLRYEPELEDHFDVNKPQQARYYRSPSLRRLTAEELLDSINLALTQKLEGQRRLYVDKASTALSRALGRPASHNEISTARPDDVAVVQALELLNGEEFYERIYGAADSPGVLTRTVFADEKELVQAIDRLYWAALSRPASAEEQKLGAGFLKTNLPGTPAVNTEPVEEVWLDDALPEGSHADGTGGADAWKWVTKSEGPVFSGERAHTQGGMGKQLQHSVVGGGQPLRVGPDDVLFTYTYLDPQHPPREIMLQWNNGNWSQRAFWGDDLIMYGEANTASRRRLGPLPKTGEWVRLEVPAREVGISTATDIAGWSFDQQGGKVYWDKSGVVKLPRNPNREPMGDVLWALFVSPEFQYIH